MKERKLYEYTLPSVLRDRTELNFSDIEYILKLLSVQWLFIAPHYQGFTITLIRLTTICRTHLDE